MIRSSILTGVVLTAMCAGTAHAEDDLFSRMLVMAQSGDSWAQFMVGKAYLNGADFAGAPPRHVAQDLEQAELWLNRAASQGDVQAEAALATAYNEGPFPRDVGKAIQWYTEIAEGLDDNDANAVDADVHLCGLVMEKPLHDPEKAEPYCGVAAAHGKPEGYFNVAMAYEVGDGTTANGLKALTIYRELAGHDYEPALERLAAAYSQGTPLAARNDQEAFRWYLRLSEVAPETWLIEVAHRLEKGVGAPAQAVDAGRYYLAAARTGNADARAWLAKHPAVTMEWVDKTVTRNTGGGLLIAETDAAGKKGYNFYPDHAMANGINGSVTVDCRVSPDGALGRCLTKVEAPEGEGFGAATIKVVPRFISIKPEAVTRLSGKLVRVTYKWQLG